MTGGGGFVAAAPVSIAGFAARWLPCVRNGPLLLKKRTLDANDPALYRPISNLSFISKVVEAVVDARFAAHAARHSLLLRPTLQSAYRPNHSTETAVICIINDMISAIDQGHINALMLLDSSAAFDAVDHQILADVQRQRFGVDGGTLGG